MRGREEAKGRGGVELRDLGEVHRETARERGGRCVFPNVAMEFDMGDEERVVPEIDTGWDSLLVDHGGGEGW